MVISTWRTSIGAVIVPLNAWWTEPELRYGIGDSGAKVVLVDSERLPRVLPFAEELGLRVVVARPDQLPTGVLDMKPMLENGQPMPADTVLPSDDATIMYTSGSTGHPKGVVSTQLAVASSVFAWEFVGLARLLTDSGVVVDLSVLGSLRASSHQPSPVELPQALCDTALFPCRASTCISSPRFAPGAAGDMRKWNPDRASS